MNTARQPRGVSTGGQFAATARMESSIALTPQPSSDQLARTMVNAVYTAGRGIGHNRYGNAEKIQAAYDASRAFVDSLPAEPANEAEATARAQYKRKCDAFERDRDGLDSKQLRTRQYEAAQSAGWIEEFRKNGEGMTFIVNDNDQKQDQA